MELLVIAVAAVVAIVVVNALARRTGVAAPLLLVALGVTVAAGTLLVQGGTLPWLVRRLSLGDAPSSTATDVPALRRTGQEAARAMLDDAALARPDGGGYDPEVLARVRADVVRDDTTQDLDALATARRIRQYRELRLRVIERQRSALLTARATGRYDSRVLEKVLDTLDAEQLMVELRTASAVDDG
ncbi:hypothetical protein ACFQO7_21605 [Catellatospora aurea]|uniref:Na+/H+ antiporter n=1 Tax=Catellatospora aurea TaxID=1337874 RepID=A0ABW2H1J4_9ACTN